MSNKKKSVRVADNCEVYDARTSFSEAMPSSTSGGLREPLLVPSSGGWSVNSSSSSVHSPAPTNANNTTSHVTAGGWRESEREPESPPSPSLNRSNAGGNRSTTSNLPWKEEETPSACPSMRAYFSSWCPCSLRVYEAVPFHIRIRVFIGLCIVAGMWYTQII